MSVCLFVCLLFTILTTDTYANVGSWTQTQYHTYRQYCDQHVCLSVCPLITFLTTDTYANVGGWTQTDTVPHIQTVL